MRVSYRWLKELLPTLEASPSEVALRLGGAGLAVDGVKELGVGLESLIVVKVTRKDPHPKRANLTLVTIDRGEQTQQVVCGASNVPEVGGMVVLAPLGASLPGMDGPLAPREIGGVLSEGMLCSEEELGLLEDSQGILVLPPDFVKPGTLFLKALPEARDTIYELDVTPNRPDALGHVGVARDLAALLGLEFALPKIGEAKRTADAKLDALIKIDNQDKERCPHYGAGAVLDVAIAPSPLWLNWRLASLGVRPISNVVDVTNLLLLEFGQPLHAFDLDHVRGSRIVVRRASAGEPFATLDGVQRKLDIDDLVICDAEGPVALAGVMGGLESEVRDSTRRILLECAYFVPRGVRRTGRRHGLHTESSHRFERGVDFGSVEYVLERAKVLLSELAGGALVAGAIHDRGTLPEVPRITLRSARLDALLGVEVPFAEATTILDRLGLKVTSVTGENRTASAEVLGASHRPDIGREADLIEEVARIRGLDKIPTRLPAIAPQPPRTSGKFQREVATEAAAIGLSEAVTYAFVSAKELEVLSAPKPCVVLINPLTEERNVMRTSLLPGLLEALRRARRHGEYRARLFTTGATFGAPLMETVTGARPRGQDDVATLPKEQLEFAAVIAGPRDEYLPLKPEDVDVFDAKGIAFDLVERVTRRRPTLKRASGLAQTQHLHPRGATELWLDEEVVGRFGPLHPDVIQALDLDGPAQVVELNLDALERIGKSTPKFRAIPRLPAVTRDLSLEVSDDVLAGDVQKLLAEAGGNLCESIELVGLFRGGSMREGYRSLTFRIVYRDPKARALAEDARTLTDKEVEEMQSRMLRAASEFLGVTLRGSA